MILYSANNTVYEAAMRPAVVLRNATAPAGSPDGKHIAFERDGRIWVVRRDGSGARRVTAGLTPAWSPDGRTLYFVRGETTITHTVCGSIFRVPARGGTAVRITNGAVLDHSHVEPAVTRDGSIAFSDWNACEGGAASPRLRIVDRAGADDGSLSFLVAAERLGPTWSPDGTRIAFIRGGAIRIANRDGSAEHRVSAHAVGRNLVHPVWSADGKWIAFAGRFMHALDAVYVVHPDGSGLRRVTPGIVGITGVTYLGGS